MARPDPASMATWMSRAALAVIVVATVVAGFATTTILRTLWSADPSGVDAYGTALALHGAVLSSVCSPAAALAVVVPLLLPTERPTAVPLALAALGMLAWLVGGAIAIAGAGASMDFAATPSPWPLYGAWSTVLAHAAFALALAVAVLAQLRRSTAAILVGLGGLAIASGVLAGFGVATLVATRVDPTMVGAVLRGATQFWAVIVSVVLAVALLTRIDPDKVGSPALVFVALAVVPAMIGERVLTRLLVIADLDVILHDTYVEVAQAHLSMFSAGAATLAALHVFELRVLGRRARAALAWPGAVLSCGGFLAHHAALLVLGTRGMPRRYPVYPESFAELQHVAQVAGAIAMIGVALVAAAWVFGRPAAPAPAP